MDEELRRMIQETVREAVRQTLSEIFATRRAERERAAPLAPGDLVGRLEEAVDRLYMLAQRPTWSGAGCSYNGADVTRIKTLVESIDGRV